MFVTIDPTREEPLFAQVASAVRLEMAEERLRPGDRLPPARDLATSLDVNLHTVLRAYQDLRDEGLVEMRRGRGASVSAAAGALSELNHEITTLVAKAAALHIDVDTLTSLVKEAAR
ncbi:GntR family transcriptional regulator [Microbacterium gorillae]|uniref:GntR family transcriptional regulator n=1 Tax=Microbacterium gorillae TaxID=1231063 RepID=UPI000590D667|nr:GntR family transcriptional regulator [Microbacterium gorillae]